MSDFLRDLAARLLGTRRDAAADLAPGALDAAGARGDVEVTDTVVRGIPVHVENTRPDIDTALVLRRLDAALGVVETYQPWRLAHLRRDLSRIDVKRFACRGAYFPGEGVCITELTFLANPGFTDAQIAASIVHEGMHARVDRMGASDPSGSRSREERICRRAELEFGRAVPGADAVVERALASLALDDEGVAPAVDWREAARRVAEADAAARRPDAG